MKDMNERTAAIMTINENVSELEELAESAGYYLIYEIIQRRTSPDSSTFIGKGKIDDVKIILGNRSVNTIIINGDMKPSQQYNLEKILNVRCIDRISLVLEIFASRASSKEARLQVEKARLKYEIPFIRDWIHRAKSGERAGHFSSGDYEATVYYNLIKKRIKRIDDELKKLREDHLYIRFEKKSNAHVICLAGYTNAGKSSLFKALTKKDTIIDSKMFSTLKPLSGKVAGIKENFVLIDTIGFLSNLPIFLIEAFKNTIDDIFTADLVLLVLDASDPISEIERKFSASLKILLPEVDPRKVIVVLNKVDKLEHSEIEKIVEFVSKQTQLKNIVAVSATIGTGLDSLIDMIRCHFDNYEQLELRLPYTEEANSIISWLSKNTIISDIAYENEIRISIKCEKSLRETLIERTLKLTSQNPTYN